MCDYFVYVYIYMLNVIIKCNTLKYIKLKALACLLHAFAVVYFHGQLGHVSLLIALKQNKIVAVAWGIWPVSVLLAVLAWLYKQWTIKLWLPHQVAGRRLPDHWQSIPWPRCPNHSCQSLNIAEANWKVVPIVLICLQHLTWGSCKSYQ